MNFLNNTIAKKFILLKLENTGLQRIHCIHNFSFPKTMFRLKCKALCFLRSSMPKNFKHFSTGENLFISVLSSFICPVVTKDHGGEKTKNVKENFHHVK